MYDLSKYLARGTGEGDTPEKYMQKYEGNPLLLYATAQLIDEQLKSKKYDDVSEIVYIQDLTQKQTDFLESLDSIQDEDEEEDEGKLENINTICKRLDVKKSELIVWIKTNKLFERCIDILKQAEAEQAESVLWSKASKTKNNDALSRMFAIKARKPEYRDNAEIKGETVVNVKVTLDNMEFDASAGFKDITNKDT